MTPADSDQARNPDPSHGDRGDRVFRRDHPVRFADVDAAGIVYYPRLLDYCHQTFEEFFSAVGDQPYSDWVQRGRIGFPTVHLDVDFLQPVQYGRSLTMTASVLRVGKRSVTFRFTGELGGGETAFRADVIKACAGMDTGLSQDITAELRALFESHLATEEPPE